MEPWQRAALNDHRNLSVLHVLGNPEIPPDRRRSGPNHTKSGQANGGRGATEDLLAFGLRDDGDDR